MKVVSQVIGMIVIVVGVVFGLSLLLSWPIQLLWNWLMPAIFHLCRISWLQAWGLGALIDLLFSGSMVSTKSKS
ncbi:MAG: hypothetical protein LBM73_03335 [Candidatus Nomurabacteria bacterium]|jgi:hypothetical protein|nr:hypothetical protein [Candidatus Nomurabacteria bacterium]